MVRVFAGFDFVPTTCNGTISPSTATAKACRWAATSAAPEGKAPAFLIRALRDADGANLDRIQVVKGWMDAKGEMKEKIYDVVWPGDRKPGPIGKLPPSATP